MTIPFFYNSLQYSNGKKIESHNMIMPKKGDCAEYRPRAHMVNLVKSGQKYCLEPLHVMMMYCFKFHVDWLKKVQVIWKVLSMTS